MLTFPFILSRVQAWGGLDCKEITISTEGDKGTRFQPIQPWKVIVLKVLWKFLCTRPYNCLLSINAQSHLWLFVKILRTKTSNFNKKPHFGNFTWGWKISTHRFCNRSSWSYDLFFLFNPACGTSLWSSYIGILENRLVSRRIFC